LVPAQEAGGMVDLINRIAGAINFDLRSVVNSRETMTALILSLPAKVPSADYACRHMKIKASAGTSETSTT
jgi:hypothetical protein